jgi:RNA polymerase sigma-54 factor
MAGPSLTQTQQQRMQMTLAPQMRQSLELLQVPMMELRTLVQQEMELNPTLEELQPDEEAPEAEKDKDAEDAADTETAEDDGLDEYDLVAQLDDEWRDYFTQNQSAPNRDDAARHQFVMDSLSQPVSLQQHLMDQLLLADLNDEERRHAELIIGSLDDDGFLGTAVEDLAISTGEDLTSLKDVLATIQEFDPIGIAARNLNECLWLQLRRLGRGDSLAATLVLHHLDQLAAHKYSDIAKALKTPIDQIEKESRLISTLDPKPGRRFAPDATSYVTPEVTIIRNDDNEYVVIMNNDYVPRLHVSEHYRNLMHDTGTTTDVKQYIRDKVRSSLFLIKSINQRQQTIFNIATEIVRVQKEFLDNGISHLRPLTMAEVAAVVGVHETTVSRAISGKYMQTPRGTFEMKYFFTPGYKTASGQTVSNETIKDTIANMVAEEDHDAPLSDQAIAKKLEETGFKVARRTIAKYREELKILPSHLRKGYPK